MKRRNVQIRTPRARRELDHQDGPPPGLRDPDVVRAKAHARGAVSRRQVNGQVSRPARNPRMQAG